MAAQSSLDTAIIARIHDALNRADIDAIAAELADDAVFTQSPVSPACHRLLAGMR